MSGLDHVNPKTSTARLLQQLLTTANANTAALASQTSQPTGTDRLDKQQQQGNNTRACWSQEERCIAEKQLKEANTERAGTTDKQQPPLKHIALNQMRLSDIIMLKWYYCIVLMIMPKKKKLYIHGREMVGKSHIYKQCLCTWQSQYFTIPYEENPLMQQQMHFSIDLRWNWSLSQY